MNRYIKTVLMLLAALILSQGMAYAFPTMQLAILDGTYDTSTQTWVSSDPTFTLTAFATEAFTDVRLALALQPGADPSSGQIRVDGSPVPDSAFEYGLPPISLANPDGGGGDLGPHDIYPTNFAEIIFDFTSPGLIYDTQPGHEAETKPGYVQTFSIDISGFDGVHFDLYTLKDKKNGDSDVIAEFAPFSHDAEFGPPVPEPGTMALLGISMVTVAGYMKRIHRKRP